MGGRLDDSRGYVPKGLVVDGIEQAQPKPYYQGILEDSVSDGFGQNLK
jgi:hypothetical protein